MYVCVTSKAGFHTHSSKIQFSPPHDSNSTNQLIVSACICAESYPGCFAIVLSEIIRYELVLGWSFMAPSSLERQTAGHKSPYSCLPRFFMDLSNLFLYRAENGINDAMRVFSFMAENFPTS